MSHHMQKKLVYISMIAIAFVAGLYGYWYFLDGTYFNPVLTFQSDPLAFQTDKKVYKAGEEILIIFSFCKLREMPAESNWRLVDGIQVTFSQVILSVPTGCYGTLNGKPAYYRGVGTIPRFVDPGVYHLEGLVTFHVNSVRDITFVRKSVDFTIVK